MRKVLAIAGVALLAGCAYPAPEHVAELNAMVGKTEPELVRAMGVPSRSIETGGSKFLAYTHSRITTYPGDWGWGGGWGGPGWGWRGWGGGWGGWGGWGPDVEQLECTTTFELVAGIVKSWTLRGNAC